MKINKDLYIYGVIVLIALASGIFLFVSRDKAGIDTGTQASISPSPEIFLTATPAPATGSPKPKPTLIIKEVPQYQQLAEMLDPVNRHLVLNADCTEIAPSQVDYANNVEVMLDNTLSSEPRVLKIGGKEYPLKAGEWLMTTLSSENLPAKLTMFCGPMELGQIDLK